MMVDNAIAITLVKINANALSTVEETRSFLGIQ